MKLARLSWHDTCARMRADHVRLLAMLSRIEPHPPRRAYLHPSFVCTFMYRLSNHLFRSGHNWMARIAWHLKVMLTGSDISYMADLGPGLVVPHPVGVSIMGTAGRNFTAMACSGLGGEVNRHENVAGWPGVPHLGDDVVLEPHSGVLGPVQIGHGVRIAAGVIVARDVPDGMFVVGPEPKFLRRRDGHATHDEEI